MWSSNCLYLKTMNTHQLSQTWLYAKYNKIKQEWLLERLNFGIKTNIAAVQALTAERIYKLVADTWSALWVFKSLMSINCFNFQEYEWNWLYIGGSNPDRLLPYWLRYAMYISGFFVLILQTNSSGLSILLCNTAVNIKQTSTISFSRIDSHKWHFSCLYGKISFFSLKRWRDRGGGAGGDCWERN